MEPSRVKERYQALKHQGPTRSLARCDSTDLLPQVVPQWVLQYPLRSMHSDHFRNHSNMHNNICPKAPEVLFDGRSTYFQSIDDDDQYRPLSARLSSASMTRQLSNLSLNQSVREDSAYWRKGFLFFAEIILDGRRADAYSISSDGPLLPLLIKGE